MGGEEGRGGGGRGARYPGVRALGVRHQAGHDAVAGLGGGEHLGRGEILPRAVGRGVVGGGRWGEQRGGGEGEGGVGQRGEGREHADGCPGVAGRVEIRGRRGEPVGKEGGLGVGGGGEAGGHRDQRRHGEVGEGGGVVGGAGARARGHGDRGGQSEGRSGGRGGPQSQLLLDVQLSEVR